MADGGLVAIGVITLLIWIFGYVPFVCFHTLRFYNFRYDITLSKRYPRITLITIGAFLVYIIMLTLDVIRLFFNGPSAFENIFDIMNLGVYFVFSCSILWRFWLSYYDIQFSIATSSREWQKYIDTDAQYDNWYFKNRKTYGDYTWTKMRFLIGTTILVIIYFLISLPNFLQPFRFLYSLCPWIFILVIYCKTPTFYDEFKIRQEMNRIIILYSLLFFLSIVYSILIFILTQSDSITEGVSSALIAVAFNFIALMLFLVCHTMTYWVLKTVDVGYDANGDPIRAPLNPWARNKKKSHLPKSSESGFENFDPDNKETIGSQSSDMHDPNSQQGFSMTDTMPNSSKFGPREKKLRISLSTMFTDIKYLNELFAHLAREFSMECLLGMIEFIQLQQYILLHMQQYKNYYYKQFSNLKLKNNVALPKGIPRSTIIYGDNEDLVEKYLHNDSGRIINVTEREQVRVRLIAYQLYKKYCAIGSEWEINISYETRGRLTAKLHNFNEWMSASKKSTQMWELAQLFEDSKHEMYRLLRHSFARFKRGDEFEKIRTYYTKRIEEELKREQEAAAKRNKGKVVTGDYQVLQDQPSNPVPGHGNGVSEDGNGVVEELVDAMDIVLDERIETQETMGDDDNNNNAAVPKSNGYDDGTED